MEANSANRAPVETRPPSAGPLGTESSAPTQPPPRPPLARADSRSSFQLPPRPGGPQTQTRPQFQPGGPVTAPPQYAVRPGTPAPRGPQPQGPVGSPQARPPPLRPFGPQSIAPQGPRPLQSPTSGQPPQRVPPPNNLQFGPRQPPQFGATTPDAARLPAPPANGTAKNGVTGPVPAQLPRQPSQGSLRGLDSTNVNQNKPINLENQNLTNNDQPNQIAKHPENGVEMAGIPKGRSYSIAAAPGAPNPLKAHDDRRKSVSALGGRIEETASRGPGLGLIQEGKIESRENVPGSHESLRSETSNEVGKDIPDRSESRLSGSKMTESFIGSLPTIKKKTDDNDDVISQNNAAPDKNGTNQPPIQNQNKIDISDRSPSLTRSEDSPEPRQVSQSPLSNKSQSITPEPQRPKTPKVESKPTADFGKNLTSAVTPSKVAPKSPQLETKPPMPVQKKPNELNTSVTPVDSKKSTPRKAASAPKSRPKDGDNDSGVDESTQGNDLNGSPSSPNKKIPSKLPMKEKSSNSLKQGLSRSSSKSATAKTPENPTPTEKKKVPMNKVQVGSAPSPNIKAVKSKIGSLENATYKPGGGKVKIENRKIDFNNVTPKIAAKNEAYTPSGGAKKITTTKLEWNAKSKIGSLQNAAYKPGGGDKKIETVKLDFKEKAKPKVASTVNITHKPGGGAVKSPLPPPQPPKSDENLNQQPC
ncbi:hypothetical protein ABMA27_001498 [Loxostege sticticalis]|uniref:Microtubule-associated protein n=1 Tax=Loxostege sticticalis TaxID=481309 RepID=A0ABR3HYQ4_LOXSC